MDFVGTRGVDCQIKRQIKYSVGSADHDWFYPPYVRISFIYSPAVLIFFPTAGFLW
jgi:hypothetical protein